MADRYYIEEEYPCEVSESEADRIEKQNGRYYEQEYRDELPSDVGEIVTKEHLPIILEQPDPTKPVT